MLDDPLVVVYLSAENPPNKAPLAMPTQNPTVNPKTSGVNKY